MLGDGIMTEEEGFMYDPNAATKSTKGKVDEGKFWQIVETIAQRFADVGDRAILAVIKSARENPDKDWDSLKEYELAVNDLYADRIEELIEELKECIKK